MQPGLHIFDDSGALTPGEQGPGEPISGAPICGDPTRGAFDVAVVMPSLMRPTIVRAVRSIFGQRNCGRVQILIGLDRAPPPDADAIVREMCVGRPPGWSVEILWPGYSTSERHGGFGRARDGGVLRSVLSQLSNAPRIAYLDDDNWWDEHHLASLLKAIEGYDWAWSGRWFVHPRTCRPVCEDQWESVGLGGGMFRERYGGFVDPNCLMIDRTRVPEALDRWSHPLPGDETRMTADRNVFNFLKECPGRPSGRYSAYYVLTETDGMHAVRLRLMGDAWERAGAPLVEAE